MTSRREFLGRVAGMSAAALIAQRAHAQQRGAMHDSSIVRDTNNLFAMDQSAALPVRRPPKPGATPVLNQAQRDELEHHLHCQCGCTLDVFTCRTTDFSCQVSPAMHRDVMALVDGGYSAQEIMDAFVGTYGERVLMAPSKSGFNLVAWFAPGAAVIAGAGVVFMLMRRWRGNAPRPAATPSARPSIGQIDATADELARLDAAIKGEDRE
jgi:cytochrome c-type biogenesis protein CcmH/NrfF